MNILKALSTGRSQKEIAAEYGVSPSYVSKLNTGKKVPSLYIAGINTDGDQVNLQKIKTMLKLTTVYTDDTVLLKFLEEQFERCVVKAQMYLKIIEEIKDGR